MYKFTIREEISNETRKESEVPFIKLESDIKAKLDLNDLQNSCIPNEFKMIPQEIIEKLKTEKSIVVVETYTATTTILIEIE